jgi:hypothetical protein
MAMLFFRWAILLLLLASGVCFALYAGTGQARYRQWGLVVPDIFPYDLHIVTNMEGENSGVIPGET